MKKIVIVSHSGGLDSSVLIAKAISQGYDVQPVNFNYGQKNMVEITAQKNVIETFEKMYGDRLKPTIHLDFNAFLKPVIDNFKKARDNGIIKERTNLEYYMPFRNLTFAAICGMIGEMTALFEEYDQVMIGLGVHLHSEGNYSKNYWDITPEFVEKLNKVMELNDSFQFGIFAPYKDGYKNDIISDAKELDVPYLDTWTCYTPLKEVTDYINDTVYISATPCLSCEACKERESMGAMAGVLDINQYALHFEVQA